jgi:hypothetical protein
MLKGKRGKCPASLRKDFIRLKKFGRNLRRQMREQGYSFGPAWPAERKLSLRDEEAIRRGQRLIVEAEKAALRGRCKLARRKLNDAAEKLNWAAL